MVSPQRRISPLGPWKDEAKRKYYRSMADTIMEVHDEMFPGGRDRSIERGLSEKWLTAAHAIREYDWRLWEISRVKALG